MNPPKIDICIEGYNIEQTDFYIGQLIEKYNFYRDQCQKFENKIQKLEKENNKLRTEFLEFVKSFSDNIPEKVIEPSDIGVDSDAETEQENIEFERDKLRDEFLDFHSELNGIKSMFGK